MIKHIKQYCIGEEVLNAVSHGIGAILSVIGGIALLCKADGDLLKILSYSTYGISLFVLFLTSTLYHALTNEKAKGIFQVFDHCNIFLLILGTYTPIALVGVGGAAGITVVCINAVCAIVGTVLNHIDVNRWKKVSMALYLIMGWLVVFIAKPVIEKMPVIGLIILLLGGIAYTVGIVFYKMKGKPYMHFIWHLFVLLGAVLQFIFVFNYC